MSKQRRSKSSDDMTMASMMMSNNESMCVRMKLGDGYYDRSTGNYSRQKRASIISAQNSTDSLSRSNS